MGAKAKILTGHTPSTFRNSVLKLAVDTENCMNLYSFHYIKHLSTKFLASSNVVG